MEYHAVCVGQFSCSSGVIEPFNKPSLWRMGMSWRLKSLAAVSFVMPIRRMLFFQHCSMSMCSVNNVRNAMSNVVSHCSLLSFWIFMRFDVAIASGSCSWKNLLPIVVTSFWMRVQLFWYFWFSVYVLFFCVRICSLTEELR